MPKRYLEKILKAPVYDIAKETPLEYAPKLSMRSDNHILLKREDLQPVFSFKLRGAYNKIVSLSPAEKEKGVIAASAGNHAQGVALSAQKLNIKAVVVMPKTTPDIKVAAVRNLGTQVILFGDSYDEAYSHAKELAESGAMTFIHPYDDPEVIAGQGTIAMEIIRQHSGDLHAIFIPVGGGGLIAGISAYIKHLYPNIKIIGVEPEDAACLHNALQSNRRIKLKQVGLFADGVAVRQIGKEPFRIARQTVDEVILANTDEICAAIKDIFDDTRSIVEPAGALAVAGLKKYVKQHAIKGKNLIAINSGANMNFDRLRHVAERAELGEKHEILLAVTIPEKSGSFKKFCKTLGQSNITEFNYRYADDKQAHVFVGIELDGQTSKSDVIQRLESNKYIVIDMSDNEIAKLHVRYMVGGHANKVENERLFRFTFPERPGALLQFLSSIGKHWNISMFHYRNHGAAYGRVLAGIQVPEAKSVEFQEFLKTFDYRHQEETDNPAYQLFLN
ncbi:MAG: threonine ammonia-lyase, biosynthetic [Gammaproteobacteria bacterium]|nr:threonine ammonia-lyase, biosynthetic [Gammaproteobacteria bacterium]